MKNLCREIDKFLIQREIEKGETRIKEKGPRKAFWPSEASIQIPGGKVYGKCLRSLWWSWNNVPPTNPMDGRGCRTVMAGISFEDQLNQVFKEMGLWDFEMESKKKFYNEDMNLSGEVDAFVKLEDKKYGLEIKTIYGWFASRQVFEGGTPKVEHLLQVLLYLKHFQIPFKLVYGTRDSQQIKDFDITLKDDNLLLVNGQSYKPFPITVSAVLSRFEIFKESLKTDQIPPHDYSVLGLTLEELELERTRGDLRKKECDLLDKGRRVTKIPWQCQFCRYYYKCLKEAQTENKPKPDLNLKLKIPKK